MPTDASAGDDLEFAAHDLGRDRPAPAPDAADDVGFAVAERSGAIAAPSADDGFVIRETIGAGAIAPVDAMVVGAPPPPADPVPVSLHGGFRVISASGGATARRDDQVPWTVRDPSPVPAPSRRGWTARQTGVMERSAQDTLRRLREDAVHVSWKCAWIAVTSADRRLYKRRDW
jgi:hypothetical protein